LRELVGEANHEDFDAANVRPETLGGVGDQRRHVSSRTTTAPFRSNSSVAWIHLSSTDDVQPLRRRTLEWGRATPRGPGHSERKIVHFCVGDATAIEAPKLN
jgi:hypothetical protein